MRITMVFDKCSTLLYWNPGGMGDDDVCSVLNEEERRDWEYLDPPPYPPGAVNCAGTTATCIAITENPHIYTHTYIYSEPPLLSLSSTPSPFAPPLAAIHFRPLLKSRRTDQNKREESPSRRATSSTSRRTNSSSSTSGVSRFELQHCQY